MKFEIKEKKYAALYLKELIVLSQLKMDRLKEYIKDMEALIGELESKEKDQVKSKVYESFNDKIGATSNYISNIFTSEKEESMSYIKFRKKAVEIFDDVFEERDIDSMKKELVDVTEDIGSWSFSMREEALIRTLEAFDKVKKENPYAELFDETGNVQIFKYENYDIKWLHELHENAKRFYDSCSPIRQQMKRDYSKLLDRSMRINRTHMNLRGY